MTGRLLTARDVAEIIGMSTETILRWTRRGEFADVAIRLPGGAIRYREERFEAWLEERATPRRGVLTATPSAAQLGTVPSITLTAVEDEE